MYINSIRFGSNLKNLLILGFLSVSVTLSRAQNLHHEDTKLNEYLRYIEKDLKYLGVQMISFKQAQSKMALTAVHKTQQDYEAKRSPKYSAEIDDKGKVYFRNYGDSCVLPDKVIDVVLEINSQRVAAAYHCVNEATGPHTVYMMKNDRGIDFVNSEFTNRKYVFVEFRSVKIAFDTDGFLEALNNKKRPIY